LLADFGKIAATRPIVEVENLILNVKGFVPRMFENCVLSEKQRGRPKEDST
jgi:hypothetical protein